MVKIDVEKLERGFRLLAESREAQRNRQARAYARAEAIFGEHPEGIFQSVLVAMLKAEGFSQSHSSSAVYELHDTGKAKMNWKTGFLSHIER